MENTSYKSFNYENDTDNYNNSKKSPNREIINNTSFPIYISRHNRNTTNANTSNQLPFLQKPSTSRLISKSGRTNVIFSKNQGVWVAYFRDLSNTVVNSRWRWTLLLFSSCYIFSWLLFAWFWFLIVRSNEDFDYANDSNETSLYPTTRCVLGVSSFVGFFLFSLETQHSIGYGTRYVGEDCPEAVLMVCLQVIVGSAICGAITSIVYTKMTIPQQLISKELFSKYCVICQRDGVLCLIFRLRDEDNKHGVGTSINAYVIQKKFNQPFLKSIKLESFGLLLWPLEVVHNITPSSPFWDVSAKDLIVKNFEVVVTMQGAAMSTGQFVKNRTSYLANEILWGHRFKPCVKFCSKNESYVIDNKAFNATEEVLTPLCSAKRLEEVVQEISSPPSSPVPVCLRPITQEEAFSDYSSGIGSMRGSLNSPIILKEITSSPEERRKDHLGKRLSLINEQGSNENLDDMSEKNYFFDSLLKPRCRQGLVMREDSILGGTSNLDDQISKFLNDIDEQFEVGEKRENEVFDVEYLIQNLQGYLDKTDEESSIQNNRSKESFC